MPYTWLTLSSCVEMFVLISVTPTQDCKAVVKLVKRNFLAGLPACVPVSVSIFHPSFKHHVPGHSAMLSILLHHPAKGNRVASQNCPVGWDFVVPDHKVSWLLSSVAGPDGLSWCPDHPGGPYQSSCGWPVWLWTRCTPLPCGWKVWLFLSYLKSQKI